MRERERAVKSEETRHTAQRLFSDSNRETIVEIIEVTVIKTNKQSTKHFLLRKKRLLEKIRKERDFDRKGKEVLLIV